MEENPLQEHFYVSVKNTDHKNLSIPLSRVLQLYEYILQIKIKFSWTRLPDNFRKLPVKNSNSVEMCQIAGMKQEKFHDEVKVIRKVKRKVTWKLIGKVK